MKTITIIPGDGIGPEITDSTLINGNITYFAHWTQIVAEVTFNANVRNFPNLRHNSNYNVIDTSEFGNAVYLLTDNGSQATFSYKNVVITAV